MAAACWVFVIKPICQRLLIIYFGIHIKKLKINPLTAARI